MIAWARQWLDSATTRETCKAAIFWTVWLSDMDKKTHSNVKLSAIKYIHGKVLTNKTKAISISIPKDSENKLY